MQGRLVNEAGGATKPYPERWEIRATPAGRSDRPPTDRFGTSSPERRPRSTCAARELRVAGSGLELKHFAPESPHTSYHLRRPANARFRHRSRMTAPGRLATVGTAASLNRNKYRTAQHQSSKTNSLPFDDRSNRTRRQTGSTYPCNISPP